MACLVCGLDRRTRDSLVRFDASLEEVGKLCYGCLEGLKENRPSRMGCGFHPRDEPCENEGAYGTATTSEVHQAGDDGDVAMAVPEDHLLCEEHFQQVREDEAEPEWVGSGPGQF